MGITRGRPFDLRAGSDLGFNARTRTRASRRGYRTDDGPAGKRSHVPICYSRQSFFLAAGIAASAILRLTVALYVGKNYIAWRHSGDPLNGQAMLTSKGNWGRPVRGSHCARESIAPWDRWSHIRGQPNTNYPTQHMSIRNVVIVATAKRCSAMSMSSQPVVALDATYGRAIERR